jgi:hypothetical protein
MDKLESGTQMRVMQEGVHSQSPTGSIPTVLLPGTPGEVSQFETHFGQTS